MKTDKRPIHHRCSHAWSRRFPLILMLALADDAVAVEAEERARIEASAANRHAVGTGTKIRSGKAACRYGNRLYRRPNGLPGYWRGTDIQRVSTEHMPAGAMPAADGVYFHNGNIYVMMRTDNGIRAAHVLIDGNGYRIRMQDGSHGPRIVRHGDGTWSFLPMRDDYIPGTILANIVPEDITTHAATLQQAARIMEVMGLPEPNLVNFLFREGAEPASPFTYMAVAHATIENLPARLRDPEATEWSIQEVRLVAPAMATLVGRPLVIHGSRGGKLSFLTDGTEVRDTGLPDAVEIHLASGRYRPVTRSMADTHTDYPSVFAAVEAATWPPTNRAAPPAEREASFRARLADVLEARSTRPELESVFRRWTDKQPMPEPSRLRLKSIARLRHALFDRHHALTSAEEQRLLEATWSLMPSQGRIAIEVRQRGSNALLTRIDRHPPARERIVIASDLDAAGQRIAYYRVNAQGEAMRSRPVNRSFSEIVDAILNGGDGRIATLLGVGSWDWQVFADKLLARIADDEKALLPLPWEPLVIRDDDILRQAKTQTSDRWTADGHHYARLRSLDGRTQVVEIAPVAASQGHEILPRPGDTAHRGRYFITWRDGRWYPQRTRDWHVAHADTIEVQPTHTSTGDGSQPASPSPPPIEGDLPVLDSDTDLFEPIL